MKVVLYLLKGNVSSRTAGWNVPPDLQDPLDLQRSKHPRSTTWIFFYFTCSPIATSGSFAADLVSSISGDRGGSGDRVNGPPASSMPVPLATRIVGPRPRRPPASQAPASARHSALPAVLFAISPPSLAGLGASWIPHRAATLRRSR